MTTTRHPPRKARTCQTNRGFALPHRFALCLGIAFAACGCGTGSGGASPEKNPNSTLAAILENGFPGWKDLAPELPLAFSRGVGIETDAQGTPLAQRNEENGILAETLAAGGATALLEEAQGLSREGISLARGAELSARALVEPLLEMLRNASLFAELDGLGSGTAANGTSDMASLLFGSGALEFIGAGTRATAGLGMAKGAANALFRTLLDREELTLRLPSGGEGFPLAIVLSAPRESKGFTFKPIWKNKSGEFVVPATFSLEMDSAKGLTSFTAKLAPASFASLSASFPKALALCEDDVFSISASVNKGGERSLSVQENRCSAKPATARRGGFSLERSAEGRYVIAGAFRAAQDLAKAGGLRQSFGTSPLFAFRGGLAQGDDGKNALALEAAAIPDSKADSADAKAFDTFGVSQVATDYVVNSFWESAYATDPVRGLLCDLGGAVSTNIEAFCAKSVSGKSTLAAFTAAAQTASKYSGALDVVTDAKGLTGALDTLVSVLSIRNTMFVSPKAAPRYADAGASLSESEVASRKLLADAKDPFSAAQGKGLAFKVETLSEADLAQAVALTQEALFSGAAKAACKSLLQDALGKAGKAEGDAAKICDRKQ